MTNQKSATLALYITRRGVSFVFLLGTTPHDWGTKTVQKRDTVKIRKITRTLIAQYKPDTLVTEQKGAPRSKWVWAAYQSAIQFATRQSIPAHRYARKDIQQTFRAANASNKHQMNHVIVATFPALKTRMPRKRLVWHTEPYAQGLFDAASLALVYLHTERGHTIRLEN